MSQLPDKHRSAARVELFDHQESEYLAWLAANPEGYVANVDRAAIVPEYPMLHRVSHGLVSSEKIGNFTTGDYVKYCSTDLDALTSWVAMTCGRPATRCKHCM